MKVKVPSVDFLLPGTKVQGNKKSRYLLHESYTWIPVPQGKRP